MTPLDLPPVTYFVCATPRSGSTLLCESLKRTGVAGCPEEYFEALRGTDVPRQPRQYFDEGIPADLEALLPLTRQQPEPSLASAPTYADYLRGVLERGTTPNGVFGAKLMWGYLADFAGRLRELEGIGGASDFATVREAFPGARFVRIVRRQKLEQAVSLWKAIQTQRWRAAPDGEQKTEPVYHAEAIRLLAQQLYDHERHWAELFERERIEPIVLSYDDVVGDLDGSVRGVLAHIGVDAPADLRIEPPLQRQADERSRAWIERFVSEQRSEASPSA